jgi:hypothetical protein
MEKNFNINEFLFGRTNAEKKLQVLDSLSGLELRKATNDTILRIYKECRGKDSDGKPRDKFYIKNDRRVGNDWNSTIEYISMYKGKAYIEFYVQNTKTDWGESVDYNDFIRSSEYRGYCEHLREYFRYNADDVANIIRCILKEFVYYKYIEKAERERRERFQSVGGYKVVNPVYNYFYEKWDCWHRMEYNEGLRKAYYAGKNAVEEYAKSHVDELFGKSVEELQAIYKEVFRKAANW